jgi:hypothetical protein
MAPVALLLFDTISHVELVGVLALAAVGHAEVTESFEIGIAYGTIILCSSRTQQTTFMTLLTYSINRQRSFCYTLGDTGFPCVVFSFTIFK